MQKLCLCLCPVVLVGAMCIGNPFLRSAPTAAPGERAVGGAVAGDPRGSGSAGSTGSAGDAGGAARSIEEGEVGSIPSATPASASPIVFALDARKPSDTAGVKRALHAGLAQAAAVREVEPVDASDAVCPVPALRSRVVGSRRAPNGQTIWRLNDGQELWRNPVAGGEPVLVPYLAPGSK